MGDDGEGCRWWNRIWAACGGGWDEGSWCPDWCLRLGGRGGCRWGTGRASLWNRAWGQVAGASECPKVSSPGAPRSAYDVWQRVSGATVSGRTGRGQMGRGRGSREAGGRMPLPAAAWTPPLALSGAAASRTPLGGSAHWEEGRRRGQARPRPMGLRVDPPASLLGFWNLHPGWRPVPVPPPLATEVRVSPQTRPV